MVENSFVGVMQSTSFEQRVQSIAAAITNVIKETWCLSDDANLNELIEAIGYSANAPSKKIRGLLIVLISQSLGQYSKASFEVAAAVEMLHTYSLVHDDLPSMDNDDYRRGRLSSHKKFNEATAILVGDALLTAAFGKVAAVAEIDIEDRLLIIKELASAAGAYGMIGGQFLDVQFDNLTANSIKKMHSMKTGALIQAACLIGAILGRAGYEERAILKQYGNHFGLIFQLVDDLLDAVEDIEKNRNTFLKAVDRDSIYKMIMEIQGQAAELLQNFRGKESLLNIMALTVSDIVK